MGIADFKSSTVTGGRARLVQGRAEPGVSSKLLILRRVDPNEPSPNPEVAKK
ncbi:MAG TPA: hypothetical protein VF840_11400 [Terriglobales bacterium]